MYEELLREVKRYFPQWADEAQEALAQLINLVYEELMRGEGC
ncbi:hypothetical protein ACFLXA_02785 [Chloroflexota bacterium]